MIRTLLPCLAALLVAAEDPVNRITAAGHSGGIVVQVGGTPLALKDIGPRFHVQVLATDAAAAATAQQAIDGAGLMGRFTVGVLEGGRLPFAERVANAVVVADGARLATGEAERVLVPRGVLVTPHGAQVTEAPKSLDGWTHYLYDASNNPLSRDTEVAPPRSFRWWAPPYHLRSHNWSSSFQALVTDHGRMFHILDEGSSIFEEGGLTERFALVARSAWNGALLWRKPLIGYGQTKYEPVGNQPTANNIWRSPATVNRRLVVQGDRLYASLSYRDGPLSILDAATGTVQHEVDLGGSVDEIIAAGDLVVVRVRGVIPGPEADPLKGAKIGTDNRTEIQTKVMEQLRRAPPESVVAVDGANGKVRWRYEAPHVAHTALAMADGIVVFHNYEALVALDAASGAVRWQHPRPVTDTGKYSVYGRALLGDLLIAEGTVLWASAPTGGGIALKLSDGTQVWSDPKMAQTGGFGAPTGIRVIDGVIWWDHGKNLLLKDGKSPGPKLDYGGMLQRGHHVRCFAGKATTNFLITPLRGAEFIDLQGDQHMTHDWIRGTCSMGNLPANGLFYVTPDPCACYSGAKVNGFIALAPALPAGLDMAPPPADASRLTKGPAFAEPVGTTPAEAWSTYRSDATRSGRATAAPGVPTRIAWTAKLGGALTPPTIAHGLVFVARKDAYELVALDQASGAVRWRRSFPGALDGPPSILGARLFVGCRNGEVYSLRASDGELAWRFLAAPLRRLSLSDDRLESAWPVSTSLAIQNGLVYAVAGRNSFLDGGLRLYALDPQTGAVRHSGIADGPRPTRDQLRTAVKGESFKTIDDVEKRNAVERELAAQPATGYDIEGVDSDLLVGDGQFLYLRQAKFAADLIQQQIPRADYIGLRPMGSAHVMAQFGMLDDSMYHRTFWMFDDTWPGKAGGGGTSAKGGSTLAVGTSSVYAAKHYEGGWYPEHKPGSGNALVADAQTTRNARGDLIPKDVRQKFRIYGNNSEYGRMALPQWQVQLPLVVRAMLAAPADGGGELVYCAGVIEGKTVAEWDRSGHWDGPGRLLVHQGADGKEIGALDLPACPVFDGLAATRGVVVASLRDGSIIGVTP